MTCIMMVRVKNHEFRRLKNYGENEFNWRYVWKFGVNLVGVD